MEVFSVFGGPGCGKSTELIKRLDRLRAKGVPPERISFVSFTRAATEEALSRISRKDYAISTIHSMCYRKLGLKKQVVVNDNKLWRFFEELGVEYTREALNLDDAFTGVSAPGNEYLSVLSVARSRLVDPYDLYDEIGEIGTMAEFDMFMKSYETWKDSYGFLDFSDMLEAAIHAKIGADYDVMFVDEAQDLSLQQWAVIESLLRHGEVKEVHIGLDDDQTLFSWAGADPHGATYFEEKFNANRVILPMSHRLPKSIHRLAMSTINKVEKRVFKDFGCRDDEGSVSEIAWVPDIVDNSLLLARTNMLVLSLERELIERRIPYHKLGSRSGGAWHTIVARALRVWKKFGRGDDITDIDASIVAKAAMPSTRAKLEDGRMAEVLSGKWIDALACSDRMVDFYEDIYDNIDDDRNIRVGTIHSSKGLEADNVYLDTRTTQKVQESEEKDPDSEIRVKYVGVTRARHNLIMIGE